MQALRKMAGHPREFSKTVSWCDAPLRMIMVAHDRLKESLMATLRDEAAVRDRVASLNWLRIAPKTGLTLPAGYKYPEFRYTQRSVPRRVPQAPIRYSEGGVQPWLSTPKEAEEEPLIVP